MAATSPSYCCRHEGPSASDSTGSQLCATNASQLLPQLAASLCRR